MCAPHTLFFSLLIFSEFSILFSSHIENSYVPFVACGCWTKIKLTRSISFWLLSSSATDLKLQTRGPRARVKVNTCPTHCGIKLSTSFKMAFLLSDLWRSKILLRRIGSPRNMFILLGKWISEFRAWRNSIWGLLLLTESVEIIFPTIYIFKSYHNLLHRL